MGRFDGKVGLISGAARGQGRSHAVRLAQEGADVAIFDLAGPLASPHYPMPTPADLAETARLVSEAGARVVSRQGDVRDREALEGFVADAVSELGAIDLVVANAGITSLSPAADLTPAVWEEMISINLTGAWNTVQIAMPSMIDAGRGGAIVFTSSIAGLMGMPTLVHYTASKHGVEGMMKALANELAPHNIRVNTVNPTNVGTPMLLNETAYRNFRPDLDAPTQEDAKVAFMSYNLLKVPWIEVEDVSNAVLWLLSDEARYVTGAAIPIDCGSLAKFPA